MTRLAILASGNGSNAENIAVFFKHHKSISVELIITNNPKAFVVQRAQKLGLPLILCNKEDFYSDKLLLILTEHHIDYLILAGFLWLIPKNVILHYPNKIINIHPALLPKFGGKGMYGDKVHQAVLTNKETESGISIHYVNENFDEGAIIFQSKVEITSDDTVETLTHKIHELEHKYFPLIIEKTILNESY